MITTERLLLRPFTEADAPDVYEYLHKPAVNCFACMKLGSIELPRTAALAPMAGVAKDISTLSGGVIGGEGQSVDWSSPNRAQLMNQAAQRSAEVVFKEKSQEEDRQSRPVQMSESELRRTADKIYHIIEDRIRRERRLLGL